MIPCLRHLLGWMVSAFQCREDLVFENLALRQQLLALHVKRPRRRLSASHKLFWVALRSLWSGWKKPLVLVTPRTVVDWHRAGFRLYLEMALQGQALGRQETYEHRDSRRGFPHGHGESYLGSATHSRRAVAARVQSLGN